MFLALSLAWDPCPGQASLEEAFESVSDMAESPNIYETLEYLSRNPLDLNRASYEQLTDLPWITPHMARSLIDHRKTKGRFETPRDLAKVAGFSTVIVEKMLPYVCIDGHHDMPKREYGLRIRVADHRPRLQGYQGGPLRLYTRAAVSIGEGLSFCGLVEKDQYEVRYADMVSVHAHVVAPGILKSTVFGDYWLDFAEGLVMGRSRYMAKGTRLAKGSEKGLVPNRSSIESGWLRGAASHLQFSKVSVYCFASRRGLDASVDEKGFVTAVHTDGLHRTESEIERIGKLRETIIGMRAAGGSRTFRAGLAGFASRYKPGFAPPEDGVYRFRGSSYRVLGTDIGISLGPVELFGEAASSISLGEGCVVGMSYREKGVDLDLLYRHYDEDFYNPHSAGFGDSRNENEEGAYLYVGCKPARGTRICGFMDLFRTLGPIYGSAYGTDGREIRLEVVQKVEKRLSLTGRLYAKGKESFHEEKGFLFEERNGMRIQADYRPSRGALMRGRFETVRAHAGGSSERDIGYAMYWEVAFEPTAWARTRARFSIFETDTWNSRIYLHESDLPGVMRNTVVSGSGVTGYALVTTKPVGWCAVSGKLSWKRKDRRGELNLGLQADLAMERE